MEDRFDDFDTQIQCDEICGLRDVAYEVIFINRFDERKIIGTAPTIEEARKIICDFLAKFNYKAPYWQINEGEGIQWIDVGSWSEFFEIREVEIYE